jgi:predicted amino acid dehydrogenase
VLSRGEILSRVGTRVEVLIVGVPFTTAQAMDSMRAGDGWALELVRRGVMLARGEGCCVVGLGGHTSIVSHNCTAIEDPGIALTSGNSLAVYAAVEALHRVTKLRGLSQATTVGVVGAAGNIGSVVAEMMAESAERVILIGHRGMRRFLEPVVDSLYARALDQIQRGEVTGVASKIANAATTLRWIERNAKDPSHGLNGFREALHRELDTQAPVIVSTNLDVLRSCQRILTASNSARPLIDASHLGAGPIVICDIAVPQDVSAEVVDSRREVSIVRGGVLEAPTGSTLSLTGANLGDGELYACLAETILIALDQGPASYSIGPLTRERVMHVGALAGVHGFEIREKPL